MKAYLDSTKFEALRIKKNLSNTKCAELFGISRCYLSALKNRKYRLSVSSQVREKICSVLDVKFDDIFFIEDSCYVEN